MRCAQVPYLCLPLCRWRNFLSPDIEHPRKSPFTEWEIAVVVQAQARYGNNWKAISMMLPGRTNRAVKNLFVGNLKWGARLPEIKNSYLEMGSTLEELMQIKPDCPGGPVKLHGLDHGTDSPNSMATDSGNSAWASEFTDQPMTDSPSSGGSGRAKCKRGGDCSVAAQMQGSLSPSKRRKPGASPVVLPYAQYHAPANLPTLPIHPGAMMPQHLLGSPALDSAPDPFVTAKAGLDSMSLSPSSAAFAAAACGNMLPPPPCPGSATFHPGTPTLLGGNGSSGGGALGGLLPIKTQHYSPSSDNLLMAHMHQVMGEGSPCLAPNSALRGLNISSGCIQAAGNHNGMRVPLDMAGVAGLPANPTAQQQVQQQNNRATEQPEGMMDSWQQQQQQHAGSVAMDPAMAAAVVTPTVKTGNSNNSSPFAQYSDIHGGFNHQPAVPSSRFKRVSGSGSVLAHPGTAIKSEGVHTMGVSDNNILNSNSTSPNQFAAGQQQLQQQGWSINMATACAPLAPQQQFSRTSAAAAANSQHQEHSPLLGAPDCLPGSLLQDMRSNDMHQMLAQFLEGDDVSLPDLSETFVSNKVLDTPDSCMEQQHHHDPNAQAVGNAADSSGFTAEADRQNTPGASSPQQQQWQAEANAGAWHSPARLSLMRSSTWPNPYAEAAQTTGSSPDSGASTAAATAQGGTGAVSNLQIEGLAGANVEPQVQYGQHYQLGSRSAQPLAANMLPPRSISATGGGFGPAAVGAHSCDTHSHFQQQQQVWASGHSGAAAQQWGYKAVSQGVHAASLAASTTAGEMHGFQQQQLSVMASACASSGVSSAQDTQQAQQQLMGLLQQLQQENVNLLLRVHRAESRQDTRCLDGAADQTAVATGAAAVAGGQQQGQTFTAEAGEWTAQAPLPFPALPTVPEHRQFSPAMAANGLSPAAAAEGKAVAAAIKHEDHSGLSSYFEHSYQQQQRQSGAIDSAAAVPGSAKGASAFANDTIDGTEDATTEVGVWGFGGGRLSSGGASGVLEAFAGSRCLGHAGSSGGLAALKDELQVTTSEFVTGLLLDECLRDGLLQDI
eukprot:GHRR01023807.1.p1 GENE.GHRR01023807.1~~GHRR01023807.1.p1  ORF type:complete len:1060 (+),score=415.73 GHRR01023807.1:73-3252(+)